MHRKSANKNQQKIQKKKNNKKINKTQVKGGNVKALKNGSKYHCSNAFAPTHTQKHKTSRSKYLSVWCATGSYDDEQWRDGNKNDGNNEAVWKKIKCNSDNNNNESKNTKWPSHYFWSEII